MTVPKLLGVAVVLAGLTAGGRAWWKHFRRKSPAERELARRLAVNAAGRLGEATVVDDPAQQFPSPNPDLIFYQYRAAGMDYSAAQDISALRHLMDPSAGRPGSIVAVKYDPRQPSNSIIICEVWSGLRPQACLQARRAPGGLMPPEIAKGFGP